MKYRAFRKLLARLLALCLLLSGLPALAEDDAIDVGDVSVEDDFAVAVDVQKNETEVNVPDKEPQSSEASDVTVNAGSVTNTTETTTSPKDDKAVFGVVVDNATDDKNVTVNAGNVNVSATITVDEQAEDDDGGDDKNDGGDDKNDGDDNNDGDNKNDGGDNNDAGNDDKNDGDGDDDGDDDGDEDGDDDDDDGDDDEYGGPKSEVYGVNVNAWTEWQDSLSEPGQNSNLTSAHVNGDVNVTGEADRPGKAAGISGSAHGNDVEISVSGDVSATGKGGMSAVGIDGYSETMNSRHVCGYSLRELLDIYEEYREFPEFPMYGIDADSVTSVILKQRRELVGRLVDAGKSIGHPKDSPLSSVKRTFYTEELRGEAYMIRGRVHFGFRNRSYRWCN